MGLLRKYHNMKIYSLNKKSASLSRDKVGGKSAPFIEMSKNDILIPKSFALDSDFFVQHIGRADLKDEIELIFASQDNGLPEVLAKIRSKIENQKIDSKLKDELVGLKNIGVKSWAVRSSANTEDALTKSWAGEFESFIGVEYKDIERYIKKVWASVFSERIIKYLKRPEDIKKIKMAVLIQEAIDASVSGVCFTENIYKEDSKELIIEAVHGIGERLVQGQATPDRYLVEKNGNIILEVYFNAQKHKLRFFNGRLRKVPNRKWKEQKLTGEQIISLSKIAKKVEKIFRGPMDIEWCAKENNIYILQSRPITSKFT